MATKTKKQKFIIITRTDFGLGINYLEDNQAKKLLKEKDFKNPAKMKFDGKIRTFYFIQLNGRKLKGTLSLKDIPKTWHPSAIPSAIDFRVSKLHF